MSLPIDDIRQRENPSPCGRFRRETPQRYIHHDSFVLEEQLQEAVVVSLCPRVSMRSVTPDWPRTRGAFAAADSDSNNGHEISSYYPGEVSQASVGLIGKKDVGFRRDRSSIR